MGLSDWSFILELYQLNGALLAFFQIIISIIIIIIINIDIACLNTCLFLLMSLAFRFCSFDYYAAISI